MAMRVKDQKVEKPDAPNPTLKELGDVVHTFFDNTIEAHNLRVVFSGSENFPKPSGDTEVAWFHASFVDASEPTNPLEVARFRLWSMPRCLGMLVSTDAWVAESRRQQGIGGLMQSIKLYIAYQVGAASLLCTVRADNKPQLKLLEVNEWQAIHGFHNPRTGNDIMMFVKSANIKAAPMPDFDDDVPF